MALSDMQKNIKHVVHLMLENRGFDHVLGWLYSDKPPALNIPKLRSGEVPFYGVPLGWWLPGDPSFYQNCPYTGPQMPISKGLGGYCFMPASDPGEGWEDVTQQIFGPDGDMNLPHGKLMAGFYLNYVAEGWGLGSDSDILTTATPADLPVLNRLAEAYAVSDTWFSSAPTETNPNRAFSLAGTSEGRQNNCSFDGVPHYTLRTIFSVLNHYNHPWNLYADYTWINDLYFTQYMFPEGMEQGRFGSVSCDFAKDVRNDALGVFNYIEPTFQIQSLENPIGNDYHPPTSLYDGEAFLLSVYKALTACPDVFAKTLLIVTFDEHGGTVDHVVPPAAVSPDPDPDNTFGRYGVRVPTILISPWVPPGCVFRAGYYPGGNGGTPFDHTSVLATLCKWLKIPYQNPTDCGWLRCRTASAPTFEDVITSTCNKTLPSLSLNDCWDFVAASSPYGLRPAVLEALLVRVTNYDRRDPRLHMLKTTVESTCRSKEDVAKMLLRLRREHGWVRRDSPSRPVRSRSKGSSR